MPPESVVVPTSAHREIALPFIEAGKHVLVEKPLASTVADARAIVEAARAKNVVLQVGHIERFNPAIRAAERFIQDPRYVVADRIAMPTFRSKDIGVVLDLMVHDLDILLEFVKDPVARLDHADVRSDGHDFGPRQAFGHLGRGRDDDARPRPPLAFADRELYQHTIGQHLDRELAVGGHPRHGSGPRRRDGR